MYDHGDRSCLQWSVNEQESGWLKIPLQVDTVGYTALKLTTGAAVYRFSSLVPPRGPSLQNPFDEISTFGNNTPKFHISK